MMTSPPILDAILKQSAHCRLHGGDGSGRLRIIDPIMDSDAARKIEIHGVVSL